MCHTKEKEPIILQAKKSIVTSVFLRKIINKLSVCFLRILLVNRLLQPELEVEAGLLADLHQPRLQRVQLRPGLLQRGAAQLEVVTQLRQPHHEAGLVRRTGLGQQVQGVVELGYC